MIRRLLPYALVAAGLFGLLGSVPVLVGGAETEATPAGLVGLTADEPGKDWVEVSGGGFWLPGTLEDTRTKESTGKVTVKADYVPYFGEEALQAEIEGMFSEQPVAREAGAPPMVLVKFKPKRYEELFPETDGDEGMDTFYRPMTFSATRVSGFGIPERLKDHLQSELGVSPEELVVLDFENRPLQRGGAGGFALLSLGLIAGGAFWVKKRWSPAPGTGPATSLAGDPAGPPAPEVDRRDELPPSR